LPPCDTIRDNNTGRRNQLPDHFVTMQHDIPRLLAAASFAAQKHRNQRLKDADESPYINHPLAVAALLANDGGVRDADLLVAALLHDTVEDTRTTFDELTQFFGAEISNLVAEVTDDKAQPKNARKQLQVANAPHKSDRAKQLKIADKICNVREIDPMRPRNWNHDRKTQYLDWAARVVAGCRGVNPRLDQLFDQAITDARQRLNACKP
jgi:guanosine-3',5'-bis(diphosphate) 3'-pyrophosphohydrolase